MNKNLQHTRNVAKSWNHLDPSFMKEDLSEDVNYFSLDMKYNLKGKKDVLFYLDNKFSSIRFSQNFRLMKIFAEMGTWKKEACVILRQVTEEYEREVVITTKTVNDRISDIHLNEPSQASDLINTGEIVL